MCVYILIIYYYLEPSVTIKYIDYLQTFNLSFALNLRIFDGTDCTKEDYFTLRAHFQDSRCQSRQGLICLPSGAQVNIGSLSRLRHSEGRIDIAILKGRYDTKVVQEAIIYIGASLSSFNHPLITKISDTRRDSDIIKEAVINIFDFLFSSSHTNLCDHDIKKIQTTEVFTGNSEYIDIDIDIRKRKIDIKIVKEAAIKVGDSLHHD